jgi:hypothetical protein
MPHGEPGHGHADGVSMELSTPSWSLGISGPASAGVLDARPVPRGNPPTRHRGIPDPVLTVRWGQEQPARLPRGGVGPPGSLDLHQGSRQPVATNALPLESLIPAIETHTYFTDLCGKRRRPRTTTVCSAGVGRSILAQRLEPA